MAENTIEQNLEDSGNNVESRIKDLSQKAKERGEAAAAAEAKATEEATARATAEKERDFYRSFSDSVVQYPQAKDFQDSIKEKVMAGYSVEDATVSVLAKEGKLTNSPSESQGTQQAQTQSAGTVAGGSSATSPSEGSKNIGQMNRDELREQLLEAEKRGDISWT